MDGKHYGTGYLMDTGDFLKQLKTHSYTPFSHIAEGIVVDLGCGTGMDAINMADMLGNAVHVVGIDYDPAMMEQTKTMVGARENVSFVQGDAHQLSFEDNTVSGIRMERVVQHLSRSEVMYQEVYRVLDSDAPVVIVETIWNSLNLYTGHVDIEKKIRDYLTGQKVKNGWAGNKLTVDLLATGFREVRLETYCMVVRSKEEANRYVFLDQILAEMTDKGVLEANERAVFLHTLEFADQHGCFTCSMNLVLAKAIK